MDEIRIEDLEIYAYHGVYPEENKKGQSFYVNAVISTDTHIAGLRDDLALSTDYGEVCHFLTEWIQGHIFRLIETAAETSARQILLHFPLVREVDVEIRKPSAPIGLPFSSVSVRIRRGWHRVYLSIGSNLGDREDYIRSGISNLGEREEIRLGRLSDLIVTKPYGGVEQGDFLNCALELETLFTPRELLEELHRVETLACRERLVHWGPRTLDMDILFYDGEIYQDEELTIPHVDLQNRFFVLRPMAQIAPGLRHPILGKTIGQLLEELESKTLKDGQE